MKEIWIANDHGGFNLKQVFLTYFNEKKLPFNDIGSASEDIVRYPYYAAKVAHAVSTGKADRGILICSTGIGMSVVANKYKGVRAALCTDSLQARLTREHNDSNVLCIGGKITGEMLCLDILDIWLNTGYIGGRHDISLGLLREAEGCLCNEKEWIPTNQNL